MQEEHVKKYWKYCPTNGSQGSVGVDLRIFGALAPDVDKPGRKIPKRVETSASHDCGDRRTSSRTTKWVLKHGDGRVQNTHLGPKNVASTTRSALYS